MTLEEMRFYREKKGYTYAQMSELTGVPADMIRKIFSGETKEAGYDVWQALERVLKPLEDAGGVRESLREYRTGENGYSLRDYYALPDEQRVELIDGVFYDMAAPSLWHQSVSMDLGYVIRDFMEKNKRNCRVFASPVDVQLDCDEKTMVQPDIVIVCDQDKLMSQCIMGAPDFVLEILSPSTRDKDMFLKLSKYRNAGVREYWIVDVMKERVIVYFFEEDEIPVIYGLNDLVPVRIYDGELKIDFARIGQPLKDFPY